MIHLRPISWPPVYNTYCGVRLTTNTEYCEDPRTTSGESIEGFRHVTVSACLYILNETGDHEFCRDCLSEDEEGFLLLFVRDYLSKNEYP